MFAGECVPDNIGVVPCADGALRLLQRLLAPRARAVEGLVVGGKPMRSTVRLMPCTPLAPLHRRWCRAKAPRAMESRGQRGIYAGYMWAWNAWWWQQLLAP